MKYHTELLPRFAFPAFVLLLALFPVSSVAQITTDPTPRVAAESLEEDLGYGYNTQDGRLALGLNSSAVFCPLAETIAVDPNDQQEVRTQLNATDQGDGTWAIPHPDTGETVIAKVQYASYAFATGTSSDVARDSIGSPLPVIDASRVHILPQVWSSCWRLRRRFACGNIGNCGNGSCYNGFRTVQVRNFLYCRYTGYWGDICLERLYPVCQLRQYNCLDCTGAIIRTWPSNRWVCALF